MQRKHPSMRVCTISLPVNNNLRRTLYEMSCGGSYYPSALLKAFQFTSEYRYAQVWQPCFQVPKRAMTWTKRKCDRLVQSLEFGVKLLRRTDRSQTLRTASKLGHQRTAA